ncbi:MAG: O-antigen ligase family protein, partial [Pseudomonadota bacterium]
DTASAGLPFILGACALCVGTALLTLGRDIALGTSALAVLFLIWLSFGFFGNWHLAGFEAQALVAGGALAMVGYAIGKSPGGLKFAWSALVWTSLIFVAISAFAFFSTPPSSETFGSRLSAGFGSPNTAATLFGITLLLAIAKLTVRFQNARFNARPRGDRIALLAQYEFASITVILIAFGCLIFTVSRAGIAVSLVAIIGLSGVELYRMRRRGRFSFLHGRRTMLGIAAVSALVLILAVSGELNQRTQESLFENSSGRVETFKIYWNVFLEKPWFGHGLGSFNAINDQITTLENAPTLHPLGAVHNVILQWLVQQGIMGVLAMTLVFGMIFYPIVRALMLPSSKPRNFLRLTIAITFLVFAHGMVDYALEIPSIMWTYSYILGLAAGYASVIQVRQKKPEE